MISLGDIVDRGKDTYECVEELLKVKNLVNIKGNHDDCFIKYFTQGYHGLNWTHGGIETIQSYSKYSENQIFIQRGFNRVSTNLSVQDLPIEHWEFFKSMKPYYIEDGNLFIHGGFDDEIELEENEETNYYWDREMFEEAKHRDIRGFDTIYIGHTPTIYFGETVPMKRHNVVNIDTGSSKGGKLTLIEYKTDKIWQA